MKVPRPLDAHRDPAILPIVATRPDPLERLVRLLARQAAAEYAAELRTRAELA